MSLFDEVRTAAREVAQQARSVRLDLERAEGLALEIEAAPPEPERDPARTALRSDAEHLAYVISLDAVNFGSGWFPFMRKRPGCSGYYTVSTSLAEHFARNGPWSADALRRLQPRDCAAVFGQDLAVPEMAELMGHFADSLCQLGRLLERRHRGRFEGLIEAADQSAERLVRELARMPSYRDVARYAGRAVPLYKRAQITVADLAEAFGGRGHGSFRDIDELTAFADNLVPHVLRREGVLHYAPELAERIDAEFPIESGSPEEIEIRASALWAVECMAASIRSRGRRLPPRQLDGRLWRRGQRADIKAHPRHRSRSLYY